MFGQDLVLLNNQEVRTIDTFLPQMTKKFVEISENFELSAGFANPHRTKTFVRIIGSSN